MICYVEHTGYSIWLTEEQLQTAIKKLNKEIYNNGFINLTRLDDIVRQVTTLSGWDFEPVSDEYLDGPFVAETGTLEGHENIPVCIIRFISS